jgi:hypothetical protein
MTMTKRKNLDMRKATLQKTLVWKAAALVAGLGLAMLSYPVHATPVSSGDARAAASYRDDGKILLKILLETIPIEVPTTIREANCF